ncbi:MAG: hypothetical protein PHD43_16865 [Methylococcales bacterium]|nr:hypothetical protein [Methylococcales bacterium]
MADRVFWGLRIPYYDKSGTTTFRALNWPVILGWPVRGGTSVPSVIVPPPTAAPSIEKFSQPNQLFVNLPQFIQTNNNEFSNDTRMFLNDRIGKLSPLLSVLKPVASVELQVLPVLTKALGVTSAVVSLVDVNK